LERRSGPEYLSEAAAHRVRLVLIAFAKSGFKRRRRETQLAPNYCGGFQQYFAVSGAIDRGSPVMDRAQFGDGSCFAGLSQELTRNDTDVKRGTWSLFKSV